MLNTPQTLFALAMVVWVVDVRFAPKPAPTEIAAEHVCHSGPSSETPAGTDFEVVVCAPRGK
jgi:hypothetical protein